MITFTIHGEEYQAEEGMTWEQWCNSEYNPLENYGFHKLFGTDNNKVKSHTGVFIENVTTSDIIIEGGSYVYESGVGGGGQ